MKAAIFLGKRRAPGSPRSQWPDAELCGTTDSNQKYAGRYGTVDDWTSWWDLHPIEPTKFYPGIKYKRRAAYRWYQTLPGPDAPNYRPLWMFERDGRTGGLDPTIPAAVRFPIEEVLDTFPPREQFWYTCQLDWMMAFHILRGYEHIILHGHGVSLEPTHMVAHRGILAWVHVARARGITVTVVPPSWYLAPMKPYGLEAGGFGQAATMGRGFEETPTKMGPMGRKWAEQARGWAR